MAPHGEGYPKDEFSANELCRLIADESEKATKTYGGIVAERAFPEINGDRVEHHVFASGVSLTPATKTYYHPSFAENLHEREFLAHPLRELRERVAPTDPQAPEPDALAIKLGMDINTAEYYSVNAGGPATVDEDEENGDMYAGAMSQFIPEKDSRVGTKRELTSVKQRRSVSDLVGRSYDRLPGGPADAQTYSGVQALAPATWNRLDSRLTVPLEAEVLAKPQQVFMKEESAERSLLDIYLPRINTALASLKKAEQAPGEWSYIAPDGTLRTSDFMVDFDIVLLSPDVVVLKDRKEEDTAVVLAKEPRSGSSGKPWWEIKRFELTDGDAGGTRINNWLLGILPPEINR